MNIDTELIIEIAKSKGISMRDISNYLRIDYSTLYRKMTGKTEFTRNEIIGICKLLEITNGSGIFFPEWIAYTQ